MIDDVAYYGYKPSVKNNTTWQFNKSLLFTIKTNEKIDKVTLRNLLDEWL